VHLGHCCLLLLHYLADAELTLAAPNLNRRQADVEAYFTAMGYMIPSFHRAYWMGWNAQNWGAWRWIDPTAGSFSAAAYKHFDPDEPSNGPGLKLCGAGNYSQAFDNAWGWMTASCGAKMPFICKMVSLRPDSTAAKAPAYVSKASSYTFMLNTTAASQHDAEETCKSQGAHLASFASVEDQVSAWGRQGVACTNARAVALAAV
jgi:hypothetical protein